MRRARPWRAWMRSTASSSALSPRASDTHRRRACSRSSRAAQPCWAPRAAHASGCCTRLVAVRRGECRSLASCGGRRNGASAWWRSGTAAHGRESGTRRTALTGPPPLPARAPRARPTTGAVMRATTTTTMMTTRRTRTTRWRALRCRPPSPPTQLCAGASPSASCPLTSGWRSSASLAPPAPQTTPARARQVMGARVRSCSACSPRHRVSASSSRLSVIQARPRQARRSSAAQSVRHRSARARPRM